MQALNRNNLCVARAFHPWQFADMDSGDKNGGPNNLRAWRLRPTREYPKGMTQQQLADAVEPPTTANMIQYLEAGERALSLKWLRRLADALDTTPGHLADLKPDEVDADILNFWTKKLDKDQRAQLVRIASALTKTGTDDN